MKKTTAYKIDNTIDRNWYNPIANKFGIVKNLIESLSKKFPEKELKKVKAQISKTLDNRDFKPKLRNRSKQIIWKVYGSRENYMKNPEAIKNVELLQTAFIEMEGLFFGIKRKQAGKNGADHILSILDELLELDEVNIEQFIIAILHDSVEDIDGYTIEHIRNTYGDNIAESIKNISKKSLFYYQNKLINDKSKDIQNMSLEEFDLEVQSMKQKEYYGSMIHRGKNELVVKFIDRIDSLRSMEGNGNTFLNKKLYETKKYFLIDELKEKVGEKVYNKLEQEYIRIDGGLSQDSIEQ